MNKLELLKEAKNIYLNDESLTLKSVGEKLKINPDRLSEYLKENGIKIRRGYNPKIKIYQVGMKRYLNGESISKISKELNICRNRFSQYLKKQGIEVIQMRNKINFNNSLFETIDTEEKAYWLGFLYADGYIRGDGRKGIELSLSHVDKKHILKFRDFLESKHKISFRESKLGKSYRLSIEDSILHESLMRQGCIPKKSLILTFPTEKQVPKCLLKHFIRGYFDGDGGICFTQKTTSINILGTNEFLSELKNNVEVLKDKNLYPLKYNNNYKNTFRIQFEGKKDIYDFLTYLYKDSNIYLDRKYEKYINFVCRPM